MGKPMYYAQREFFMTHAAVNTLKYCDLVAEMLVFDKFSKIYVQIFIYLIKMCNTKKKKLEAGQGLF